MLGLTEIDGNTLVVVDIVLPHIRDAFARLQLSSLPLPLDVLSRPTDTRRLGPIKGLELNAAHRRLDDLGVGVNGVELGPVCRYERDDLPADGEHIGRIVEAELEERWLVAREMVGLRKGGANE